MRVFTGIPVSEGIAIGRAFVYVENVAPEVPRYTISLGEVPAEWERLQTAIEKATAQVRALYEDALRQVGKDQADIFQAHLFMLEDTEFFDDIGDKLQVSLHNIEWVVHDMSRDLCQKLAQSPEPAFRERAADIADVSNRLIGCLLRVEHGASTLADLDEDAIIVAHDLMPSDTLLMDKTKVKGIVLDEGGKTSHTTILARAFGIPTVVGLSNISGEIRNGETIIVNGISGQVVASPDIKTLERQENESELIRKRNNRFSAMRELPAETKDGHRVALLANIGLPEEAEKLSPYGAEGIGLYRSEFIYIMPGQPGKAANEEAQYEAYGSVLKAMGKMPVTIRTLDVGGDKVAMDNSIPGINTSGEKNPLLGWRGIRLSFGNPELFKVQLRALLRASVHGKLKIMFPLICCIEEVEQAHAMLDEARDECRKRNQPFADDIDVGVMIEVPSAAISADIIAEKSDFFSVGTNDLIQYSLAVDRGNEKVHYLSNPHHPAVLRLLERTICAAHEKGIKTSVCGELAGDISATAILLGMGLDEFSMNATSIPKVKEIIRGTSLESCRELAREALRGRSGTEVRAIVNAWMMEHFPKLYRRSGTRNDGI